MSLVCLCFEYLVTHNSFPLFLYSSEVRNPVAAAMSACSFVKTAIEVDNPLATEEQRQETREDVSIIDNALRFVNDLLRNMLDMHRAANKQLKVNMTPTDILTDVLESVFMLCCLNVILSLLLR